MQREIARVARIALLCGAAPSALASCSPFSASDTDVEPAGVDAGKDAERDTPPDGGVTARWCATNAPAGAACFDFDGTERLEEGWTRVDLSGESAVTLESTASSPPRGLRTRVAAGTGARRARVQLQLGAKAWIAVSFDVRAEKLGAQCTTVAGCWGALAELAVGNNTISLYAVEGDAMLQNYTPAIGPVGFTPFAIATWRRVKITVDAAAKEISLDLDGERIGKTNTFDASSTATTISLGIGNTNDSSAAWEARYDNVVIESR